MTPQERARYQAEVMLAYANGAEIEYTDIPTSWVACSYPTWNWLHADYRVKKPAPKVVKLEAWIYTVSELRRITQDDKVRNYVGYQWKRILSLDLEYMEE